MQSNTKEKKVFKIFRLIFWGISITTLCLGIALMRLAETSEAYVEGTTELKFLKGEWFFWLSLIVGIPNLIWGIVRWILRLRREKWTVGKTIGKLILGGLWRFFAIVPVVLISFLLLAPLVSRHFTNLATTSEFNLVSSSEKILADYESGKISANDYVRYIFASMYNKNSLPENYRSDIIPISTDLLSFIDEHIEEVNVEVIQQVLEVESLSNVNFDTDASGNVETKQSSLLTNNTFAAAKYKTLNKAVKSKKGSFVIFYTDTGDDKISDAQATQLGDMLEDIIFGYKNNLNLDYKYTPKKHNISNLQKVLRANNLDENLLDTAMPVLVVNPMNEETSILGSYVGLEKDSLKQILLMDLVRVLGGDDGMASFYRTTPIYPFIHMMPSSFDNPTDTKLVIAHELGHHYNSVYCQDKIHNGCGLASSGFIDETMPSYLAVNAVKGSEQQIGDAMQRWHMAYINKGTKNRVDDNSALGSDGYPMFAFLQNYVEIVPNGLTISFDAVLNNKNTLNYLYEKAGAENFQKVMDSLGQKNLTNSYSNKKSLYASKAPKGESLDGCLDLCSQTRTLNPASLAYLYFPARQYSNKTIKIETEAGSTVSVLGLDSNNKWTVINGASSSASYSFVKEEKYKTVAFVVASGSVSEEGKYTLKIASAEMIDLIDEGEADDLNFSFPGGLLTEDGAGYYLVNTNNIFNFISQFTSSLGKLVGENLTVEMPAEAREELAALRITFCVNEIKNSSFDAAKQKIQSSVGWTMDVFDQSFDASERSSVFVGADLFTQTGKVYSLNEFEGDLILLTINIKER